MLSRIRPRSNDDANSIVRGRVRMFDSTTPLNHHLQPCPRAQSYTQATSTHTRAGALTFPSSCLDGSVSRVGPGQYPQHTRAWSAREALGRSLTTHHSTAPPQTMSPTIVHMIRQSKVSHGSGAMGCETMATDGGEHARPRRRDRRPHAATQMVGRTVQIVKCQVLMLCLR